VSVCGSIVHYEIAVNELSRNAELCLPSFESLGGTCQRTIRDGDSIIAKLIVNDLVPNEKVLGIGLGCPVAVYTDHRLIRIEQAILVRHLTELGIVD
jgi:hypothetical protein